MSDRVTFNSSLLNSYLKVIDDNGHINRPRLIWQSGHRYSFIDVHSVILYNIENTLCYETRFFL